MKRNLYIAFLIGLFGLAPCVHAVWDVTTPAGSESKSLGDDRIREFKSDVQTTLRYEGDFPGPDTTNPRFIYTPSTGTSSQRPVGSTATAVGMLFINKSSGTIEQYNGSGWDVIATTIPLAGTINVNQISTAIAGAGLDGGGGVPLRVNVDSTTFNLNNDTVTIIADSIGTAQLANAVSFPTSVNSTTFTWQNFGILPILQMQSFTINTSSSSTSATFVLSNLQVSITPKLATSKILVYVSGTYTQAAGASGYLSIGRNGSSLASSSNGYNALVANSVAQANMFVLDSPSTTSAITYSAMMKCDGGVGVAFPTSSFGTQPSASIIAVEIAQ